MAFLAFVMLLSILRPMVERVQAENFSNEIRLNVYNAEATKNQGEASDESMGRFLGRSNMLKLLVSGSPTFSGSRWKSKNKMEASAENTSMLAPEDFETMIMAPLMEPHLPKDHIAKRGAHGSKFSLSIDVPTNILSIMIGLAKAKDMRAKAAANAEFMARIGRRR